MGGGNLHLVIGLIRLLPTPLLVMLDAWSHRRAQRRWQLRQQRWQERQALASKP
jgi:hypothetical protein